MLYASAMTNEVNSARSVGTENDRLLDQERRTELLDYFDLAWDIFVRLEREGRLDALNLTSSQVNPTVKPPNVRETDQPNKNA
jgi:hypothetical protein